MQVHLAFDKTEEKEKQIKEDKESLNIFFMRRMNIF